MARSAESAVDDDGLDLFSGTVLPSPSVEVDRAILAAARDRRRTGPPRGGPSVALLVGGALAACLVLWVTLGGAPSGLWRDEPLGDESMATTTTGAGSSTVDSLLGAHVRELRGELLAMRAQCPSISARNAELRAEIERRIARCLVDLDAVESRLGRLESLAN